MNDDKCCICKRKTGNSGFSSAVFGRVHFSCMNRAEDFVRAMSAMNGCTADHYLSEIGRPSMQTMEEPMAQFVERRIGAERALSADMIALSRQAGAEQGK